MCLDTISEKKIAKKDIKCWKYLNFYSYDFPETIYNIKSGSNFTGIINGIKVSGMVYRDNYDIYFFSNELKLSGLIPYTHPQKYNYNHSWKLDDAVKYFIVDGIKYEKIKVFITPYYRHKIICGETYISEIMIYGCMYDRIEKALHSYKDMASVKDYNIYARCTIPKGSTYYIGVHEDKISYASNALRYDKIYDIDRFHSE